MNYHSEADQNKGARSSTDFCEWAGIGKTTFWAEVKAGRLKVRYLNSKVLVTDTDGREWLASLPEEPRDKAA